MLDMVIAFDTTGSMSAYIEAVKLNIKDSRNKTRLRLRNSLSLRENLKELRLLH